MHPLPSFPLQVSPIPTALQGHSAPPPPPVWIPLDPDILLCPPNKPFHFINHTAGSCKLILDSRTNPESVCIVINTFCMICPCDSLWLSVNCLSDEWESLELQVGYCPWRSESPPNHKSHLLSEGECYVETHGGHILKSFSRQHQLHGQMKGRSMCLGCSLDRKTGRFKIIE